VVGDFLVRAVFFILAVALAASGCSHDDKSVATSTDAGAAAVLQRNCADAKWREQNLGLWYSVCRQPLRW